MTAIVGALRAARDPLAFGELAIGVYDSKIVARSRQVRRRQVAIPHGDVSNLRRALRGLIRDGDVVVVGSDALRDSEQPSGKRYALSDRSTGNEGRSATPPTPLSVQPEPLAGSRRAANDVAPDGSGESSGTSIRLTPAGAIPVCIRGELSVPARVFAWERGLLSPLVDDLFRSLNHAAIENDESDP
jgi:hypothetical protein